MNWNMFIYSDVNHSSVINYGVKLNMIYMSNYTKLGK